MALMSIVLMISDSSQEVYNTGSALSGVRFNNTHNWIQMLYQRYLTTGVRVPSIAVESDGKHESRRMIRTVLGLCCTLSGKSDDPCRHDKDVGDEEDGVTEDIAGVEAVGHFEGVGSGKRRVIGGKNRNDLSSSVDGG